MKSNESIARFKADLLNYDSVRIVRRHVIFGPCSQLGDEAHFRIREVTSDRFKIHPNEVHVVGSGKLGFSIAPAKRYRPFNETSDIDLAIISGTLFSQIWSDVFLYDQSKTSWPDRDKFIKYLFRGWIRPDMLPPSSMFPLQREWFEFFDSVSGSGECGAYKIRAGLYANWSFLEQYQTICVKQCRQELDLVS